MNRIDNLIDRVSSQLTQSCTARQSSEQIALENAQLLDRHFTEQKATLLRRSIPKCENEDANGRSCEGEAKDVCVHCERALCVSGGCFDDVCSAAPDGKHLPAKVAIDNAVASLAQKMRMVG